MRKITALFALAGFVAVVPAGRVLAQGNGEQPAFVQWQSPDDGARVGGQSYHVKAKVAFDGGVKNWAVQALAPDGADYPGYGTICEKAEGGSPAYVNIDCVWDTTAYPNDGGPAQNRPYVVRVTAQGGPRSGMFSNGQAPGPRHEDRNVVVSNPVSAPRDVKLAWADGPRQATVQWQPNPEPDIASYVVQEKFGDGPWKTVGQAGGKVTTFTRNLSATGTYRYQVAAVRAAGSGTDTIQSAWAGPAVEPKQIVVQAPKRPETTTTTTEPAPAEAAGDTGSAGAPADPGTPPSTTAPGVPGDPAAPAGPAPAGSPAEAGRGAAGVVSPIQAGAPGSVKSGGATFGSPVAPLAAGSTPAKPGKPEALDESEGPDNGFASALPYKQADANADKEDGDSGRVLVGMPETVGGDDTRRLLIPLAAGLLLFVFAMHALYAARRAGAEAKALETE